MTAPAEQPPVEITDPRQVIADALHAQYCGDETYEGDPYVQQADERGHHMDADLILQALRDAGFTLLRSGPIALSLRKPDGSVTTINVELANGQEGQRDG